MEYSKMPEEKIQIIINILQDLYNGKREPLSEENKNFILEKLMTAKLDYILNR